MAMNHSQALKHRWRYDLDVYLQNRKWLHEDFRNSDSLLITVGDSWTWGDNLGTINKEQGVIDDYDYRVTNIYGYHLANKLDCDWVNIAVCGADNTSVMLKAVNYIKNLQKQYKHIQVVITLTESGRELNNGFLNKEQEYNQLKGTNWPTFSDIVSGTAIIDNVVNECYTEDLLIGYDLELYYAIKDATNINDLFEYYEAYTFQLITKLFNNVSYLVGRNFTQSFDKNKSILNNHLIDDTWVDIIAKASNIHDYPKDVYVLSNNGLTPILNFAEIMKLNNKKQLLPIITASTLAIDWLHNSPYNAKIATKHPLEQAHIWWAEHIYKWL